MEKQQAEKISVGVASLNANAVNKNSQVPPDVSQVSLSVDNIPHLGLACWHLLISTDKTCCFFPNLFKAQLTL